MEIIIWGFIYLAQIVASVVVGLVIYNIITGK